MSQWGYTEAGAKPQPLLLSLPANKVLFLSHTVYEVFTVTPGAQRKEGGVHSGPGFEDGPCRLQPGGLTKVTPLPTPQATVSPSWHPHRSWYWPNKVCEHAPPTWVTAISTVTSTPAHGKRVRITISTSETARVSHVWDNSLDSRASIGAQTPDSKFCALSHDTFLFAPIAQTGPPRLQDET